MKKLIIAGFLLLVSAPAAAQSFAIINAEIHPVSGPEIEDATIVVEHGVISAVGTNVLVPEGIRVIDGTGMIVTPGLIDSNSRQIGVQEIGTSDKGSNDITTSEKDLGASFNLSSAINPENSHIAVARLRGVTSTVVHPIGQNVFVGQGTMVALRGSSTEEMIRGRSVSILTALGRVGANRAGGSRAAVYRRIHDALWDARAKVLSKALEDSTDGKAKEPEYKGGRSSIKGQDLEALQRLFTDDFPLVVSANRASDLDLALGLQSEFGIKMVIWGGTEAWKLADRIADADVSVLVYATNNIPTFDGLAATLENAGRLQAAGVNVLLTGNRFGHSRSLAHETGVAVANGMDHGAALRAITLGAAEVWGVSDKMGSLDKGKIADIVVWSGDPFELSTSATHVFISGHEISDDNRQKQLFERYKDLSRYRKIRRP